MRWRLKTDSIIAAALVALLAGLPGAGAAQQSLIEPGTYRGIAADRRAYRIGDILTVNVLEAARARSSAATDANSDVRVRASASTPGYQGSATGTLSAGSTGGAETSRAGELRTQLSVRVTDVLPDGTLAVEGAQSLVINGEDQKIMLSGLVRPEDIRSDNSLWSHRIANAQVEFSGSGVVSQSQRTSIVYRALKWLRLL
ncbi:MAG TPA: flagellar biosynthesis protein FlgH [Xanthomonadaceae bacterium]|nr:flagellar biosynthesis protein FlgH [Xanthomonadaceae bacterium]